ncbi:MULTISPECIES: helix-turn-helix transcriptional regulator [Paenibacillus]|uniref:Helix-turn-helix transcriptional regulator n=1 Tax=Paenibacillus violae TaxID=3077234 RepID=A0ABU3RK07_9BACL|nr:MULTISPECIES: helix-turn-helix transcriptional regulator [Paenibacillus]MDU0204611.1 helix-turn-helix transcriptional regulator [Paenibacillus sp. PFR10]MEC0266400.1 helix-turn-helix transcriptional regulator [Paenibacillus anseongense]
MSQRLGEELRRLRKKKGLTLEEAASAAGITLQYMSLLEKGQRKSASFEIMANISRFYGIPLDYFAQFVDDDQNEVHNLSETELEIWSAINNKVKDEIYYKKGDLLADWLRSFFRK